MLWWKPTASSLTKKVLCSPTLDGAAAYKDADYVIIAAPTNYDPLRNFFDTHHIEDVINLVLSVNPNAVMVIKSTIPVGYCRSLYVPSCGHPHSSLMSATICRYCAYILVREI